jgi:catechol 2,3-dioxygenase-like lactoylglutathione lyase family enzyme
MELGAFSVSLTVSDIATSRAFYEKLGFRSEMDGSQGWLIMKNGATVIGLFQGMFEKNLLTFNPGWDQDAQELASFTDVRELRRQLEATGLEIGEGNTDESAAGPAYFMVVDPDGNPVLFDQHR